MSTPAHDDIPAEAQADIDAALKSYTSTRETLPPMLAGLFAHADDAADALLSTADEFGAEEAIRQLRETPHAFGDLVDAGQIDVDTVQALEAQLDAILDGRDRLDQALRRASGRRHAPGSVPAQRLHIDGQMMRVEPDGMHLRALDDTMDAVTLDGPVKGGRDLTLSEEARYRAGVDRAEPRVPDRTRDRTR